ncbi:MAG TPA: chromosomal replication initiator protein DnaA [Beijerinckiaceae bacterium]|nr:chromosomal replication initiator protein DnaA [Beijerinckiaceae bacterium]
MLNEHLRAHESAFKTHESINHEAPNAADLRGAWTQACRRLRAEVGEDVFVSWFARLELESTVGGCARLSVPTKFLKSWITAHYTDRILAALSAEVPGLVEVAISLRTSARPNAPRPIRSPEATASVNDRGVLRASSSTGADSVFALAPVPASAVEIEGLSGSPLDRRLTFSTFLVGRSNQLAHAAALRVSSARAGEPLLYNPLYIHSSVGLGKTHLLQAAAHAAMESGRRVIYLTAEKFMYGFVFALKNQSSIAFKEKLRAIDVLVIDDVQFLQGKSIQHEFCHTLNALIDSGRQIIIAADRPPVDLESLEERVRSRLAGGLCVEMGSLDEALRARILETRIAAARLAQPGFEVSASVVAFVARAIQTNGRDLDGAVNRLLAHSMLSGSSLSVETAEIAIRDLVRAREPKRVKIEDIQKLVATHYNVSRSDILSSRRTATVVRPRQIAMYLSKVLTLRSLPEIGRRFGGRDHTTVLHAVRKIEGLAGRDGLLSEELELLKRMLTD